MSFPNALSLLHLCLTWALRPRNCRSEQCWIDTFVFFYFHGFVNGLAVQSEHRVSF